MQTTAKRTIGIVCGIAKRRVEGSGKKSKGIENTARKESDESVRVPVKKQRIEEAPLPHMSRKKSEGARSEADEVA